MRQRPSIDSVHVKRIHRMTDQEAICLQPVLDCLIFLLTDESPDFTLAIKEVDVAQ